MTRKDPIMIGSAKKVLVTKDIPVVILAIIRLVECLTTCLVTRADTKALPADPTAKHTLTFP